MAPHASKDRRWVEIGFVVLEPDERPDHLPTDTKSVPYYVRVKGFLEGPAQLGDVVTVETLLGRKVEGELLRVDPPHGHDFGLPIQELIEAGCEARSLLESLEEQG